MVAQLLSDLRAVELVFLTVAPAPDEDQRCAALVADRCSLPAMRRSARVGNRRSRTLEPERRWRRKQLRGVTARCRSTQKPAIVAAECRVDAKGEVCFAFSLRRARRTVCTGSLNTPRTRCPSDLVTAFRRGAIRGGYVCERGQRFMTPQRHKKSALADSGVVASA